MKTITDNLLTIKLTYFIGKDISNLYAQVRNPIYINEIEQVLPMWRTLKNIKAYKEKNKMWLSMEWIKEDEYCNSTGCTIDSDHCQLQIFESAFNAWKLKHKYI